MSTEDQMPHSADSEQALLGSVLLDPTLLEQARRELPAEWFYIPSRKVVYQALLSLLADREEINSVTLADRLRKDGTLDIAGGVIAISKLDFGLPHVTNLKCYIKPIKETA